MQDLHITEHSPQMAEVYSHTTDAPSDLSPSDALASPKNSGPDHSTAPGKPPSATRTPSSGVLMPGLPDALMGKGGYSAAAPNSLPWSFREKAKGDEKAKASTDLVAAPAATQDFPQSADAVSYTHLTLPTKA